MEVGRFGRGYGAGRPPVKKEYWAVQYKEPSTGCWQHIPAVLNGFSGPEATAYAVYLTKLDNRPHMVVHYFQVGRGAYEGSDSFMITPEDVK